MSNTEIKVGDLVRVRDPYKFVNHKKITDRDATVIHVFALVPSGSMRATIRFHKRNGRGKEFEEVFRPIDLVVIEEG